MSLMTFLGTFPAQVHFVGEFCGWELLSRQELQLEQLLAEARKGSLHFIQDNLDLSNGCLLATLVA